MKKSKVLRLENLLSLVHNLVQLVGWAMNLYIIYQIWKKRGVVGDVMRYKHSLYKNVYNIQLLQWFDLVLCLLRITKTSPLMCFA